MSLERTLIGLLLAKLEVTYATDPVPVVASNVIAISRSTLKYGPKYTHVMRAYLDGTLDKIAGLNVLPEVDLSFEVEIRGNRTDGTAEDISDGTVGNAIEIDCLLQACDLAPVYTAESSDLVNDGKVIYSPTIPTDQGKSCTFYFFTGLKRHIITGCKGTLKGILQAGQFGKLQFDFKGLFNPPTDVALPGGVTWLNTKPPIFQNTGSTVDAFSPVFQKLDFDLGNKIDKREDANSANGVAGFIITDRTPKCTIDPESVAEATNPVWGDLTAATSRTITALIGTQAGNKFAAIFKAVSESVAYGDRTGIRTTGINYAIEKALIGDTAGSQFQLKFQ